MSLQRSMVGEFRYKTQLVARNLIGLILLNGLQRVHFSSRHGSEKKIQPRLNGIVVLSPQGAGSEQATVQRTRWQT